MTKKRLAEATGLSTRALTSHEAGEKLPSDDSLRALARALEFPLGFFIGDDIDEVNPDGISFRALSRLTAGQRDAAIAAASLAVRLGRWIESRFNLPPMDVPEFHEGTDPESAAMNVRLLWGLGQGPIGNLIHTLEAHGVRVFSLTADCREMDAISLWDNDTPYVFLNTIKSAERGRFDVAHELGHLVLHRHGQPSGRPAEEEANAFASALLMPKDSVIARCRRNPSLSGILEGRTYWGVSAMAYAYRLRRVDVLTDWYYHQLARKLSAMGLRSGEDVRQRETSQLLRKVFETLRGRGVSRADVARELEMDLAELDRFIFGLVMMTGIRGGGDQTTKSGSHLRLVHG